MGIGRVAVVLKFTTERSRKLVDVDLNSMYLSGARSVGHSLYKDYIYVRHRGRNINWAWLPPSASPIPIHVRIPFSNLHPRAGKLGKRRAKWRSMRNKVAKQPFNHNK